MGDSQAPTRQSGQGTTQSSTTGPSSHGGNIMRSRVPSRGFSAQEAALAPGGPPIR